MIAKQCREWLEGWAACAPEKKIAGLRKAVEELGGDKRLRWEVSLRSDSAEAAVGARCFGGGDGYPEFAKAAAARFGLKAAVSPPKDGLPWLELWWDVDKDEPKFARLYDEAGAAETPKTRLAFKPSSIAAALKDPTLKEVFADVSRLCRVRDIVTVWDASSGKPKPREDWSLRFSEAVLWPDFARLSLAQPLAEGASLFTYVALDRRVSEVLFTGGALVVYLRA